MRQLARTWCLIVSFPSRSNTPLSNQQVTEYEVTYTDVVPKDKQAVTTRKVEVDRHHEVREKTRATDRGSTVWLFFFSSE